MIQMMIKETIFDSTVNEKIKERYDDVIEQYSKMASLYECKISDIMDTYGTSEHDIWNAAEQQEKTYEICQFIFDKEKMNISSKQKKIIEKQMMREYFYEDIDSYINAFGQDTYEETLLIDFVLDKLYSNAIIEGAKEDAKKNRISSTERFSF